MRDDQLSKSKIQFITTESLSNSKYQARWLYYAQGHMANPTVRFLVFA